MEFLSLLFWGAFTGAGMVWFGKKAYTQGALPHYLGGLAVGLALPVATFGIAYWQYLRSIPHFS